MRRRRQFRRTGAALIALAGILIAPAVSADRFDDLLKEAQESKAAGKKEEAIAICEQVIVASSAPHDTVMHCRYLQGIVQQSLRHYDAAIASLKAVIQADPKNKAFSRAYGHLNSIYEAKRFHEEGIHGANLTHEIYPSNTVSFRWRAGHLYALGLYEEAIADLERYLRETKSQSDKYDAFGTIFLSHLLLGDFQAARDTLARTRLEVVPHNRLYLEVFAPAMIEMIRGDLESARKIVESGATLRVGFRNGTRDDLKKKKKKKRKKKKKKTIVIVTSVLPESPAAKAGILRNDVILNYGGLAIETDEQLTWLAWNSEPGVEIALTIERDGKKQKIAIIPERRRFKEKKFREFPVLDRYWRKMDARIKANELWASGRRREVLQLYADFASRMMPDRETIREIADYVRQLDPPPAVPDEARTLAREGELFSMAAIGREDVTPAIEKYREAARLAPWWSDAHYNLGLLYERRGDFILAANSLRNYLTLAGDSPDARAVEARVFEMEYRGQRARR